MNLNVTRALIFSISAACLAGPAAAQDLKEELAPAIESIEEKIITWRRDIHEHPELGNREFRTSALVADHLRGLGLEVETGIAHTGVVGILRGGRPGPVVALRADMDGLPVTEATGLPFASKARSEYNGQEVGVMHACGHDAHTAILMGVAEVLAGVRDELPGTVKFIFQPAEEGPPPGEDGGASLMVEEGVLGGPVAPEAIFGLHVFPYPPGMLLYRSGGLMASSDRLHIKVEGRQTHGAYPWNGVDPVVAAAQIITALQTIPSRQVDLTQAPVVVTIARLWGGARYNIIPDVVEMEGTVRTLDPAMREDVLARIRRTAGLIAESSGAKATVTIENTAPVTYNDPELTRKMVPSLTWAAGPGKVEEARRVLGAEDFSFYQQQIPGMYVFLGINEEGVAEAEAAPNHSPYFDVNEATLLTGVRALTALAVDYLSNP